MINKRIISLFIIYNFLFILLYSQESSRFTTLFSYIKNISKLEDGNNRIFALTDGKLFSYYPDDGSLETHIKSDRGNSDISQIAFNQKNNCLILSRQDADIDILFENNSYKNIPDLKNSTQNIDKTINNIYNLGDYAYLATNFGYLILDIKNGQIKESGTFNIPFNNIIAVDNNLYASTKNGILTAKLSDNLQDLASWKKFDVSIYYQGSDYGFSDDEITQILDFNGKLTFLVPNTAVYIMDTPNTVNTLLAGNKPILVKKAKNNHIYIINSEKCWNYTTPNQYSIIQVPQLADILPKNQSDKEFWIAAAGNNLSLINTTETGYNFISRWIKPDGPAINNIFSLNYQNGQLLAFQGGFTGDRFDNPGDWSILRNQKWINFYQDVITEASGVLASDFVYGISDPKNQNRIFVSSWGEGLYEFLDGEFKTRFDYTNSTLERIYIPPTDTEKGFSATRVSGLDFDKNGNLWVLNSMVKNIVKIYTLNNEWKQIYFSAIDSLPTSPKSLLIDKFNNKWITTWGQDGYLFVFNENNTIDNTNNHKWKFENSYVDQSGNSIEIFYINHLSQDSFGTIWISTSSGPFYVQNTNTLFTNKNIVLNKVMIEKDAVNNTVGPLLEKVPINSIAVDGANRKWIATQSSGVYLLSANNKEIIQNFNMDNSPLPSNSITALAIDPVSGVVYMGTDKGLISYTSDATQGAGNFSNVVVYPNPVRPDYSGSIAISGLMTNSIVKITDLRGNLLNQGTSLGGQYNWDGRNAHGQRVATGVYLVFGSADNGSEGMVTKIMVVSQ